MSLRLLLIGDRALPGGGQDDLVIGSQSLDLFDEPFDVCLTTGAVQVSHPGAGFQDGSTLEFRSGQ